MEPSLARPRANNLTLVGKKDRLFRKKGYPKPFAFNEQVAQCFDDMVSRSVPLYREVNQHIAEWAALLSSDYPKIYDLGCSTGTTLIHLAKALGPDCQLVGVDASQAMIDKAKKKLELLSPEESALIHFEKQNLIDTQINQASLVILNYTLQFIPVGERRKVLELIHTGLADDGMLYLSEKIKYEDPLLQENSTYIYENFKEQAGYTKIEIARKKEALENVLVPFSQEQLVSLLRSVGFVSVQPVMQWNNFVSIIARKGQ